MVSWIEVNRSDDDPGPMQVVSDSDVRFERVDYRESRKKEIGMRMIAY